MRAELAATDGFVSAQDLHDRLRHRGEPVGLTTVYRHLGALADEGEVDQLRTGQGEAVYRRCGATEHHHHLVCRGCGRTQEVAGDAVEAWATAVAAGYGFSDPSHTVELFGICGACQAVPG